MTHEILTTAEMAKADAFAVALQRTGRTVARVPSRA